MRSSGKFIVLEGVDGAGTTTQAMRLVDRLKAEGKPALFTREPSDGPIGLLLRDYLVGRRPPTDPAAMALLFAADRLSHLRHEIEPALAQGCHVVCDRYVISSLAYQSLDLELSWVQTINGRARTADLTIFFDVSVEIAASRRAAAGRAEELYDALETQKRVDAAYRNAIAMRSEFEPITWLDASLPLENCATFIWEEVSKSL